MAASARPSARAELGENRRTRPQSTPPAGDDRITRPAASSCATSLGTSPATAGCSASARNTVTSRASVPALLGPASLTTYAGPLEDVTR
jgi:hypothetical protein